MRKYLGIAMSIFFIVLIIALPVFYFSSKNNGYTKTISIDIGEKYSFNQESEIKSENNNVIIENNEVKFTNSGKYTIIEKDKTGRETKYVFEVKKDKNNIQDNNQGNDTSDDSGNNSSSKIDSENKSNNNTNPKPNSGSKPNNNTNPKPNSGSKPNNSKTKISIDKIYFDKSSIEIKIGEELELDLFMLPQNANDYRISWSSSDNTVVSVAAGIIKGIKPGSVTITAKSNNGKEASVKIIVKETNNKDNGNNNHEVTSVMLSKKETTIKVDGEETVYATVVPSDTPNKEVKWKSSNEKVATVSNGKIKGIAVGTATITATSNNGKTASIIVHVESKPIAVNSVTLNKTSTSIVLGSTETLTATVSPSTVTNKEVKWISSNEKIATVSEGKITPKRSGIVTITAKTVDGGKTASCEVTITGSRIHFIDIDASADVILLESNGKFALVDTGVYRARSIVKSYLDSLDITTLEFLINSHNHADHNGSATYLSTKYNIKKLYLKTYLANDNKEGEDAEKAQSRYNEMINAYSGKVVYVDKDSKFKETSNSSGYITLGKMKIYFFNTNQRLMPKPKDVSSKYVSYYKPSYYYGGNENLNSLVNLVEVNGHYALLMGDMNLFDATKDIFKDRINGKIKKIDVFKLPHHGIYNCFGSNVYPNKPSYTLSASIGYYVVTRGIDGKYDNGKYVITHNKVIWDSETEKNPKSSCIYNIAKGDATKAKEIMCNAYYASDATGDAIIFNLSNDKVKVAGGGQGKTVSSRCK